MNKICLLLCCLLPGLFRAGAQELKMTECAPLTQIYGEVSESDELLPMGDVGVEFGYVLYQAAITVPAGEAALELENVRDYAAVYLDGVFQGTLTDNRKTLVLKAETGQHTLQLYVENIGRITYGPEILDNSKGLFGEARLGGETIAGWTITPLEVRDADPEALEFEALGPCNTPCFRRGQFDRAAHEGAVYLDVSGWAWARCGSTGTTSARSGTRRNSSRSSFRPKSSPKRGTASWFSTSKTTTPAQRCASRTNPCSNNKHNL